jgi:flagellar FliL protein
MSKAPKPAEATDDAAPPKKSKKLLIIIIAVLVLVLGGGGAAAYLLMSKSADHADEDEEEVVAESKSTKKKKKGDKDHPPAFVALDPFTVNLVAETGDQFLQLIISVEVADMSVGDRLKMYMPKLRNDITLLLSTKKASELISKEGKEKLAGEIRDQMNSVVEAPAVKGKSTENAVKEVLFTSFIIQ